MGRAKAREGGKQMYGTMGIEISKQRRENALREVKIDNLARTSRAGRKELTTPRSSPAVIRELARAAGLIRKTFSAPKSAD
jgi:hypothetical protein